MSHLCSSLQQSPFPELTVIVPAFNEAATVEKIIDRLKDQATKDCWEMQLIIVDDGSTDGTSEALEKFKDQTSLNVIFHLENQGKGAAIRTGLSLATGELVIIQDADLEYDPGDITNLLTEFCRGHGDVIFGSRVLGARQGKCQQRRNIYAWGVCFLNLVTRCFYKIRITDEATCYKLFRTRDLLRMQLRCQRFEFCPEVTAKAARLQLKIVEIPIAYHPRSNSEGKKIQFWDAIVALKTLWRFRNWNPEPATSDETL